MACCLDIGTGTAANVLASSLKKVLQELKMVMALPQLFSDMEDEVERLNIIINDINLELARVQMTPKEIVKAWLHKAGETVESSRTIRSNYQQHKNCISCCPNCLSRYKISKHITDWKVNVDRLHLQKVADFPPRGEYGYYILPTHIPIEIPVSGFVGNAIQSMQSKVEKWLIEDTNVRIIGVHGMGGVGKTALLQAINNSIKVCSSFELIIWVTVSKDYNILNLQDRIANRLKLPNFPENSSLEERKHTLFSDLKDKQFLLILDDLWKSLELQDLGVSLNDRGSKIVLTTRNREVCTSMQADEITRVEPLSGEEGWQLFCSRAFRNRNVPQDKEDVARKIAGECKGLPLAINVIAAATRNFSYQREWDHALHQIQSIDETFYGMRDEIEEQLFERLKWSFNSLQDYLQICFLYFAAYEEDKEIDCGEVIDIWIAEGLVKGSEDSYLHDTAHSFISCLCDRCLIEVVRTDQAGRIISVKIHDILRDLAIRIGEKEHRCYFKAGQGMTDFPVHEVDGKGWERMSFVSNQLHSLPTSFACSALSVLLLRGNPGIKEVSFLLELSSLKVLDLSETGITSLPPSIGNLKHLAFLQLKQTDICELPESICKLTELQLLDVRQCKQLRCLPETINELKRLRTLDIRGCSKLSHLPRGISEMLLLERLMIGGSISLDFGEDTNPERKNACFKDLQSLRHLRDCRVYLKSAVKDGVMGNWWKLRDVWLRFDSDVNQNELPQDMQAMKDLERFWLIGCDVERLPGWLTQFRKLAYLDLRGCKQLKKVPAELPCLRELWIEQCDKLEELELGMGFPKLERLGLWYLSSLKSLECVGAAASGSGGGVTVTHAQDTVTHAQDSRSVFLRQIEEIGLGEGASPLPMLKTVEVCFCDNLKRLRGGWDKLKFLDSIECRPRQLWDAIECDDPTIKTSLQSKLR